VFLQGHRAGEACDMVAREVCGWNVDLGLVDGGERRVKAAPLVIAQEISLNLYVLLERRGRVLAEGWRREVRSLAPYCEWCISVTQSFYMLVLFYALFFLSVAFVLALVSKAVPEKGVLEIKV
jgi:hypothetical protein